MSRLGAPVPSVTDPPLHEPINLHTTSLDGRFYVYGPDGELKDDQSCAYTPGDSIKAKITVGIHDSQPHDPLGDFTRSFVMQIRVGYTQVDAFQEEGPGAYEGALSQLGEHGEVVELPLLGHLSPDPFRFHEELRPGTYVAWVCAVNHFLLNVPQSCLAWTSVCEIAVYPVPIAQPQLTTIPFPPSPQEGDQLYDVAILRGGSKPTGTITFYLLDAPAPGGNVIFEDVKPVNGNNASVRSANTDPIGAPFHGHWRVEYSGDAQNMAVTEENEPVELPVFDQEPAGADEFPFVDEGEVVIDDVVTPYPGIFRLNHADTFEQWFTRTDNTSYGPRAPTEQVSQGPTVLKDIFIGGRHAYIDQISGLGARRQMIKALDDNDRALPFIMGLTVNALTGDVYGAGTPDELLDGSPHDICWLPDDTGLVVAVVTASGVLELRRYDYNGNLEHIYAAPAVDRGFAKQAVKIDIACDARTLFYVDSLRTIFRYDLVDEVNLTPYQTTGGHEYIFTSVRVLPGSNRRIVVAASMGNGPRKAVALDAGAVVWVDEQQGGLWVASQRRLLDGHEESHTTTQANPDGLNDQADSMAAWYMRCTHGQMMASGEVV